MIPLSVIDAFTDSAFGGNPAAVCVLPATEPWPSDDWLQKVGREMNLSETAFLKQREGCEYELRWFTPAVEVALCGHATLAAAHFLWESGTADQTRLTFSTCKSGLLAASRLSTGEIELDFPAQPATRCLPPDGMVDALGAPAVAVGYNGADFLVELQTAAAVRALKPDFARLSQAECRGVIVTAASDDPRYDFVSRFFAPRAGVPEDPVTGSAHCCLAEHWGERFGKSDLTGFQASERGGVVRVKRAGGRVKLIGRAVAVTRGELLVRPA